LIEKLIIIDLNHPRLVIFSDISTIVIEFDPCASSSAMTWNWKRELLDKELAQQMLKDTVKHGI